MASQSHSPSPSGHHKSGGVWLVADAPVATSSEMYKFPTLCPHVKPHHDALVESDREDYRTNLLHIIDQCMKYPEVIKGPRSHVEKRVEDLVDTQNFEGNEYFAKVSTLGCVDEGWLATWLTTRSKLTQQPPPPHPPLSGSS